MTARSTSLIRLSPSTTLGISQLRPLRACGSAASVGTRAVSQPGWLRSASFADRGSLAPSRLGEVPEAITLNAFASYRFDRYRIGLNVYNLTDELNYTQVFGNRAVPAAGRTVIVSFGATF